MAEPIIQLLTLCLIALGLPLLPPRPEGRLGGGPADPRRQREPRTARGRRRQQRILTQLVTLEPAAQAGWSHPVGDEITLGRAAGCAIVVDDTYVSQLHARVFRRDGQLLRRGPGVHERHLPEPPAGDRSRRAAPGRPPPGRRHHLRGPVGGRRPALRQPDPRRAGPAGSTRTPSTPTPGCSSWPTGWAATAVARWHRLARRGGGGTGAGDGGTSSPAAILAANDEVLRQGELRSRAFGMGTTVVAAIHARRPQLRARQRRRLACLPAARR